jgi:hypothetical protein
MNPFVISAICLVLSAGVVYLMLARNRAGKAQPMFENDREEQLTRRVAAQVKCPLGAALESVRQELDYSPGQSDDVLVKRAVYHYNQAHPAEHKVTYCDRIRG